MDCQIRGDIQTAIKYFEMINVQWVQIHLNGIFLDTNNFIKYKPLPETPFTGEDLQILLQHYKKYENHAFIQCNIGLSNIDTNIDKAIKWLQLAADQNYALGQYYLAIAYGETENYKLGLEYFELSAKNGCIVAHNALGRIHKWVKQDHVMAYRWHFSAAQAGCPQSQHDLANLYFDDHGMEKNYSEALKYYILSATTNDPNIYRRIFVLLFFKKYGLQNYTEAFKWCKLLADKSDSMGQYYLGISYRDGKGTQQDNEKAMLYLK